MKGDFSRVRFNPAKQYTAVLQQQGRAALDADANEQCAIGNYLRDTETVDIVGRWGYPADLKDSFFIQVQGQNLKIGAGRYYVNGILCWNPEPLLYGQQTFLLNPSPTDSALLAGLAQGSIPVIQVYLEVWQRLVTILDDVCLREPALGQADTTARLQTVWRVIAAAPASSGLTERIEIARATTSIAAGARTPPSLASSLRPVAPIGVLEDCCAAMRSPLKSVNNQGRMNAFTGAGVGDCSCQPTPPAGYIGLENQLYRVEIHQGGSESEATFKWSRENASVAVGITGVSGAQVYVDSVGFDANLGLSPGQWVEISDDSFLFGPDPPNQPGNLYQIQNVTPETLSVTMAQNTIASIDPTLHACVRRWDQFGSAAGTNGIALPVAEPYALENGISVRFSKGQYEPGDYWLIPARTATGEIDWPPCDSDGSAFQPPRRIEVYRAPLACIQWDVKKKQPVVHDCRDPFYPLTELGPPQAAAAAHVTRINWTNDDIMTLDQLVERPLSGTVSVKAGSPAVSGRGTSFTTELTPGQWILFAIDNHLYQVSAVNGDTNLTLSANYRGDTDKATTALVSGLTVTLDQPAPDSQLLTPANFVVTLEVAVPVPLAAGSNLLKAAAALPEPFRNSILPLLQTQGTASAASLRVARLGGDLSAVAIAAENVVNVVRFDLILDGYLGSGGSALNWLPILSLGRDIYTLRLIDSVLSIGSAQGILSRVRVKLEGRTIFTTGSSGAQIYLDGQSFGTPGSPRIDGTPRIDLRLPSGDNAKASNFESWFYLAPIVNLISLTVSPSSVTIAQGKPLPSTTGTVTLNYAPGVDTAVTLSVAAPSGVFPAVSVPAQVIVPKNATSQTFTISIAGNTNIPSPSPFVITASLPPALGTSRSQTATLQVTGYAVIQ